MTREQKNEYISRVHKKLTVLYPSGTMKQKWTHVMHDYEQETCELLRRPFTKYMHEMNKFESWLDTKLVQAGKDSVVYVTKGELKQRGWTPRIIELCHMQPQKKVYLGRGRYVYYYELSYLLSHEDSETFLIAQEKRKQRRSRGKDDFYKEQKKKPSLSDYNLL